MNFLKNHRARVIAIAVALLTIVIIAIIATSSRRASDISQSSDSDSTETTNDSDTETETANDNSVEYRDLGYQATNSPTIVSSINNFGNVVDILPDDEYRRILDTVNYTMKLNNITSPVSDVVIRDGSYQQSLTDTNKLIYLTEFMIDIPSLRQSYFVRDYYSPLPVEQSGLYDYTIQVSCPNSSQLIYEPFNCTDRVNYEINGGQN